MHMNKIPLDASNKNLSVSISTEAPEVDLSTVYNLSKKE
jgi:hypothetical protein